MEPLRKDVKQAGLDSNVMASPEDLAEYELLLSQTFAADPDAPAPAPTREGATPFDREQRLAELYKKLFPARSQAKKAII